MDLFTRIATQRLGQARTLRAALAPHYAPRGLPLADAGEPADARWPGDVQDETVADHTAPAQPASARTDEPAAGTAPAATDPAAPSHAPMAHSPHAATVPRSASGSRLRAAPAAPDGAHAWPAAPVRAAPAAPPLASTGPASPAAMGAIAAVPPVHPAADMRARRQPPWTDAAASPDAPLAPDRAAMLAAPTPSARAGAGPVVHVHIDRIDVRAPVPSQAAPAPRVARPAPARSLADYLRQRGGT